MKIDAAKCTGCGLCKESCAVDAIALIGGKAELDTTRCIKCRMCLAVCPVKAVKM